MARRKMEASGAAGQIEATVTQSRREVGSLAAAGGAGSCEFEEEVASKQITCSHRRQKLAFDEG